MPLFERKRYECPALPKGWQREELVRKSGLSAGRIDVFYYSPNGKKFRTKPQLARYLGDTIDLATFDFRTGKVNSGLLRKNRKQKGSQYDYSRGLRNDNSLLPPIRQTASIFKQPVTLVKTQDSKVRLDVKHGTHDKPKQLFWEKRLEGLRATDAEEAKNLIEEDMAEIVGEMKQPQLPSLFKANITVNDEDIRTQEERVLATRAKLQEVLKHLNP
nr:EOG090X0BDJ [Lepidurus arcticus]